MRSVGVRNEACTSTRPLLMQHPRASYPSPSCYRRCTCNESRAYSVLESKAHVQGYLAHKKPELKIEEQIWAPAFLNLLPEG